MIPGSRSFVSSLRRCNVYRLPDCSVSIIPVMDRKMLTNHFVLLQWVQDGSPQHANNAIKIENAHQFAPVQIDPNEFRKKQKEVINSDKHTEIGMMFDCCPRNIALQMKSSRLQNKISSGPQSNILEGVTWEEVRRMNDDQKTSDQVVMVGAASKGIIQKDFQQNAVVYKSAYSRNPFEGVTDKEIQDYKDYVAKKQRGEPGNE